MVKYGALLRMFAQVSGLTAGELVHVIADAHIYDRHEEIIKKMILSPVYPAPVMKLDPDVKNFYDFKVSDFTLEGYNYNDIREKFEVAV